MLSQLSSDFFARSPLLAWPVVALGIFMCVFVVVSLRALLARRDEMQRMAELAVHDSERT
jgi:hypothetical protein